MSRNVYTCFSIYCQERLIKILLENKKINHLTLNSNLTLSFLRVINETVVWFRFYDVIIFLADSVFFFFVARAYMIIIWLCGRCKFQRS